ncbi:MAG: hypothetical protein E7138_07880 [Rikenellaceae bacterium]|nr:hypothetical protein [Rikenellaceae bacterium]MBQ3536481.1 hypothetical protein [Alistipes sp.]MBQ8544628.1 hypothetical protein [Alistipes sp.]MBR3702603.1 hypothetical protein [Alistipes sp.]
MSNQYNEYDDDTRYDDEYGYEDQQAVDNKAVRGYRIVIIILAVILVALSVVYFNMHREQQQEYVLLEQDRTRIQGDLDSLIVSFDDLQVKNDSMTANLEEANKLMDQLKNERRLNYAKIRAYEKELGTLKTIMKTYLRQIDSLNTINQKLTKENVSYKKQISTAQLRAEMAEERAEELNNKVRVGSVIRVRSIGLEALNARDKVITRVKGASRLRVLFTISANELAEPGNKTVYACVTSPEGYLLSSPNASTFNFEGEDKLCSQSREMDYEGKDLPGSIYIDGTGFTAGTYKIEIYIEGRLAGSSEVALR